MILKTSEDEQPHVKYLRNNVLYETSRERNNMHRNCKIVFHIVLNIISNRQTKILLPHPLLSYIKLALMPFVSLRLKFSRGIL